MKRSDFKVGDRVVSNCCAVCEEHTWEITSIDDENCASAKAVSGKDIHKYEDWMVRFSEISFVKEKKVVTASDLL